jgi:hypothetical protein
MTGAQRGFFAFDPARPGTADVLTERLGYVSAHYQPAGGSLELAQTRNHGRSFSTSTAYTAPRQKGVRAEGLIRHSHELLAFGELLNVAPHQPGTNLPLSAIVSRSADGGRTWSSPARVFDHSVGADLVSDYGLLRPASGPDGTIYIPDHNGGKLQLVRSRDGGRTWRRFTIGDFGDVSEPMVAAGPGGTVAVAFYKISQTTAGQLAAVRIAVSGNRGAAWKLLSLGKPFLISSLGPTDDSSPLGPVQGIAAHRPAFSPR